jgi:uncharacterized protein
MQNRNNLKLKFSRYNICSNKINGNILIYNSLTQNIGEFSDEEYQDLLQGNSIDKKLIKFGFLVPKEIDEFKVATKFCENQRNINGSLSVTIVPSLMCNFSCGYCYNGIHQSESKNNFAIKAAINYIKTTLTQKQSLHVTWYGGEPTLFIDRIESATKKILMICKKNSSSYSSNILTNGSLLTEINCKLLPKLKINHVQISIDWPIETATRSMRNKSTKETLSLVLCNINYIPKNVGVTIRVNGLPNFLQTFTHLLNLTNSLIKRKYNMYIHRIFESNVQLMNTKESQNFRYNNVFDFYKDYLKAKQMMRDAGLEQEYFPKEICSPICMAQMKNDLIFVPDGTARKCVKEICGPGAIVNHDKGKLYKDKNLTECTVKGLDILK